MKLKSIVSTGFLGGLCLWCMACTGIDNQGGHTNARNLSMDNATIRCDDASGECEDVPPDCDNDPGVCDCDVDLCLPQGATIDSAVLTLHVYTTGSQEVTVHRVTQAWQESSTNWESFNGSYDANVEASFTPTVGPVSVDITALVQGWINQDYPNYGLLLTEGLDNYTDYYSGEYSDASLRPSVEICYSNAGVVSCDVITEDSYGLADTYVMEAEPTVVGGFSDMLYTGDIACAQIQTLLQWEICFDEPTTCAMGDFAFYDLNADGIQDEDEPGVPFVPFEVHDCSGSTIESGVTDPDGYYLVEVPCGEEYKVEFTPPTGLIVTAQDQGSDDSLDSDVDPNTNTTACIEVDSVDLSVDVGFVDEPQQTCIIGDYTWNDLNQDGIQNNDEPAVPGVSVVVHNCTGGVVGNATTDADGTYLVEVPCGGQYQVEFVSPTGMVFTTADQGADDTLDSDVNPDTNMTSCVAVDDEDLTVDAGLVEIADEPCGPCEGKITELTLQYNGETESVIKVFPKKKGKKGKKGDEVILFEGVVAPGGQFTVLGFDKKGTLGTEISLYVEDALNTKIHTSCSKPIGPGLVSGDFEVIKGYSLEGGLLCAEDNPPEEEDCECDGKVTNLTLEYKGEQTATVRVTPKQKKRKKHEPAEDVVLFEDVLEPGDQFSITGYDKNGTLGTEISIFVADELNTQIHTSCSQPIGPGLVKGDFEVIKGSSLKGGPLCTVVD